MSLFWAAHELSLHFSLQCVSPLFMVVQRKTSCVPVKSLHLVNPGVGGVNDQVEN